MKKDTLGAQRLRKWDLDREDKYGTTNTLSAKQFKEADIVLGLLTAFLWNTCEQCSAPARRRRRVPK